MTYWNRRRVLVGGGGLLGTAGVSSCGTPLVPLDTCDAPLDTTACASATMIEQLTAVDDPFPILACWLGEGHSADSLYGCRRSWNRILRTPAPTTGDGRRCGRPNRRCARVRRPWANGWDLFAHLPLAGGFVVASADVGKTPRSSAS